MLQLFQYIDLQCASIMFAADISEKNPRCVFKKSLKLWWLWERQPMQVCSRDFGKQGVTLQPFLWEYQTKPITKNQTSDRVPSLSVRLNTRSPWKDVRSSLPFLAKPNTCKQPVACLIRLCSLTEHTSTAPPCASVLPCARISCDVTSPESPRAYVRVLMDADTHTDTASKEFLKPFLATRSQISVSFHSAMQTSPGVITADKPHRDCAHRVAYGEMEMSLVF